MGKGSESVCHHQVYGYYQRGQRCIKRRPLSPTREQKLGLCIEMHGQALFQEPVLQKLWVPKQPYRNAAMGAETTAHLKPVVSPLRA